MLDIIICEDNNYQRQQIEDILKEEIKNFNFNIALSTDNPQEVIEYVQNNKANTFLSFLDVELDSKINGIELAKIIRKYDSMGYIVFITSHAELTYVTFQYRVQAMDYIIKTNRDCIRDRIIECMKEAYNDFKNNDIIEVNQIPISVANTIVYFNLNDILFFETTDKVHKLRIHTCTEQLEFYSTLKKIEKMVSSNFYRTHRSYLVNTNKIKSIDKDNLTIYMENDETCYVSARCLKGLLKKCLI